ncbi:EAL domain-containing protein [Cupriavidus basilensis]|uniref:EAL domain-containing protein n=1 Tax=Cupriavidus basilensis TaxID=68895 RepID=A0ABT6ANP7_9BURK|nr:EAL domain-containing protein [Cupriavidus basilensis]MDF3834226.1 EAL domain-containing protein [Cupriavidus basilensis]
MHFTPTFTANGCRLTGAQALLGCRRPIPGLPLPNAPGRPAERNGAVDATAHRLLDEVCWQVSQWDSAGLRPPRIAIGVAPGVLRGNALLVRLGDSQRRYGLGAGRLMLECTEAAAMRDPAQTGPMLEQLRAMGVAVALDDFGSGCSSLAHLRNLAIDQIKIDRQLVQGLDKPESRARAIVAAIIEIGRTLDMEVVAKGVETREQLDALCALGCAQVQGTLLSLPLSGPEFAQRWLA